MHPTLPAADIPPRAPARVRRIPPRLPHLIGLLVAAAACWPGALSNARAGTARTQTIPLHAGWNAVFLEVQPTSPRPDALFADLPVETVACFLPGRQEAEYLRSPGDAPWREEGWAIWHAASRPDAFLSNLHEIQAQRGLLILASRDFVWSVSGEARATVLRWHPNTCTLTGLPVDPAAPPTFSRFFAGSAAHRRLRIFRLESGSWRLVRNPATERASSGEAYWIQTDGASRFQGPLRLELPASGELDFDESVANRELGLINEAADDSASPRIEWVRDANALPLRWVNKDPRSLAATYTPLSTRLDLPSLAAGHRATIRLEPHRDAMPSDAASTLLRIADGRGTQIWLPVRARRGSASSPSSRP